MAKGKKNIHQKIRDLLCKCNIHDYETSYVICGPRFNPGYMYKTCKNKSCRHKLMKKHNGNYSWE